MRILLRLGIVLMPALACATEPCIPAKVVAAVVANCQAIGELAQQIARLRDAGIPLEDALSQFSTGYPQGEHSGPRLIVQAIYDMPTWNPIQHQHFVELTCLKKEFAK